MRRNHPTVRRLGALLVLAAACGGDEASVPLPAPSDEGPAPWNPDVAYDPGVEAGDLQTEITNLLFPATAGMRWVYQGETDEGTERIEVEVLADTRDVWGVAASVIHDSVYLEGELIEDTWDWYAQDADGNVWYLGEETYELEDGERVCDCGAWESGIDGALPGIIMLADPRVGRAYRQEYYAGEAEDIGEIVALGVEVTVPAGSFSGCIKTRDLSAIERDVEEFKYACPGVGVVLEQADGERVELVEFTRD
jgi:hypothetical protein